MNPRTLIARKVARAYNKAIDPKRSEKLRRASIKELRDAAEEAMQFWDMAHTVARMINYLGMDTTIKGPTYEPKAKLNEFEAARLRSINRLKRRNKLITSTYNQLIVGDQDAEDPDGNKTS